MSDDEHLDLFNFLSEAGIEAGVQISKEQYKLALANFEHLKKITDPTIVKVQDAIAEYERKFYAHTHRGLFEDYQKDGIYDIVARPFRVDIKNELLDKVPTDPALFIAVEFETVDMQIIRIGPQLMARMNPQTKSIVMAQEGWLNFNIKVSKLSEDKLVIEPHTFEIMALVEDDVELENG